MDARGWIEDGTALFLRTLDGLTDEQLEGASLLPGWSRAHVVAHVHHNALGIQRLLRWATTGVETPMYESRERRDADIDDGATLPPDELRALVRGSAAALEDDLDAVDEDAWSAEVRSPRGAPMPVTRVLWMRAQETLVHTVDLDAGTGFEDLPQDFTAELVRRVADQRSARAEAPALAAWLTGRSDTAPTLEPWA